MLPIQQMLVKYNFNKNANKPYYIVIHDTGNLNAGAYNHYLYFNGGNRGASAHYFVDKSNIIQIIEDTDAAWHCGDGKGKYGITNRNSIGIEICINNNIEQAYQHTIDLTTYLMKKYNIPIDRVVRHYDTSRKSCPNFMNKDNWAKWWEFKTLVQIQLQGGSKGMTKEEVIKIVNDIIKPSVNGEKSDHWATKNYESLRSKGIEIHDKKFNDAITRGEVFALLDRIVK